MSGDKSAHSGNCALWGYPASR